MRRVLVVKFQVRLDTPFRIEKEITTKKNDCKPLGRKGGRVLSLIAKDSKKSRGKGGWLYFYVVTHTHTCSSKRIIIL